MAATPFEPPWAKVLANHDDNLWKEAYEKLGNDDVELYERLQSIITKDLNAHARIMWDNRNNLAICFLQNDVS